MYEIQFTVLKDLWNSQNFQQKYFTFQQVKNWIHGNTGDFSFKVSRQLRNKLVSTSQLNFLLIMWRNHLETPWFLVHLQQNMKK